MPGFGRRTWHISGPRAIGRLVDAYLKLWSTGDGELMGSMANAVIRWRVRQAAPMLATALREGEEPERVTAHRL